MKRVKNDINKIKLTNMTKNIFIVIAILLIFAGCFSGCKEKEQLTENALSSKKNEIIKVLKDEPAYIIKGCFEYSRVDSISIALKNYPEGIITIFPSTEIPEQYRVENLEVLVSGNIINHCEFNNCFSSPNVKLAPTHIFELTNIK